VTNRPSISNSNTKIGTPIKSLAEPMRLLSRTPKWMATRKANETEVAITPGVDFDAARGHRFVRFSYAGATEAMAEGARRLKAWHRLGR